MKQKVFGFVKNGGCVETLVDGPDENALPASIQGSVGIGGANIPDDAVIVQTLLNQIREDLGGPKVMLNVDGACGPKTISAIRHFQYVNRNHLLIDGLVEPNRNTWKKLLGLSRSSYGVRIEPVQPEIGHSISNGSFDVAAQIYLNLHLYSAQYRIYEAIKSLDKAANELQICQNNAVATGGLFKSYKDLAGFYLVELPLVDRCFHIAGPKMKFATVKDCLGRLRRIYVSMMDVIVASLIGTDADWVSGKKRFVRPVPQSTLNRAHAPIKALADAVSGGGFLKNGNKAHIRIGNEIGSQTLTTTLVHELSHFVSRDADYIVDDHGSYNAAFNDPHHKAVRNAFCYEWYAFLAWAPIHRSTPNANLTLG